MSLVFIGLARAEDIDWDRLVGAVIRVESGGNSSAVSSAGAIGLMQITPNGAMAEFNNLDLRTRGAINIYDEQYDSYKIADLFNIERNIFLGTWYLHRLHDHYRCDTIEKILMAYNWGIGNCRKVDFDLTKAPRETKNYVKKVMAIYGGGK